MNGRQQAALCLWLALAMIPLAAPITTNHSWTVENAAQRLSEITRRRVYQHSLGVMLRQVLLNGSTLLGEE